MCYSKVKQEYLITYKRIYFFILEKRFPAAIEKYTEAIEINNKVASYYTNRAFCHLKLESYGYAIA
jgi:tetratricopeptide (TPR) repeat protein